MSTETSNWMSNIADDVVLNALVMPGSHDAGMSETNDCDLLSAADKGLVRTQSLSVDGQLRAGSRYFDIRVDDYRDKSLVTYHRSGNIGCNGQTLDEVFKETEDFLTKNKTETAILKISHIRGDPGDPGKASRIRKRVSQFLESYRKAMYCNNDPDVNLAMIALGNLRGKMVVVFDYSEDDHIDPGKGQFRYRDGMSEVGDEFHCDIAQTGNLTVCDRYSDTDQYQKMSKDQIEKWRQCAQPGAGRLFLLSWTLTPKSLTGVKELAAEANGYLPKVLKDRLNWAEPPWVKPNIVYIDYVDGSTCRSIIKYNDGLGPWFSRDY